MLSLNRYFKNQLIKYLFNSGKFTFLFKKIGRPTAKQWADYLRLHGGFQLIGNDCEINLDAVITDPYLVKLADFVTLSSCALICHDGSIAQVARATGIKADAVGKIEIRSNCFIGYGAIVLRNTVIHENSIIAAGAVVTTDVPENSVVAGIPAKRICSVKEFGERLMLETSTLPWGGV